jgi:hypothetical protein
MLARLDVHRRRFFIRPARGVLLLALLLTAFLSGCAQQRYITLRERPNRLFSNPFGLLVSQDPTPTPRTLQLLRRYDLVKLQEKNPELTLVKLQQEIESDPDPDKIC